MDINSPNSLWKDYDVTALPFNTSKLSEKTEHDISVKELYFDGYTTVDGRARAYLKIFDNPDTKGVVLYLCDTNGGVNDKIIDELYNKGYTVAALDYLGRSDRFARFTLYPDSLAVCNSRGKTCFEAIEDAKACQWYIWTCIARRAIRLLSQMYTQKLHALGVGLGGSIAYKLSVFEDGLSSCATLLNINPEVTGNGNAIINYRASLDNSAYAPFCRIPIMMAIASNDEDGSLDDMSELAESTASLKLFRVAERAFSGGISQVYDDIDKFFSLDTYSDDMLVIPKITASNSDGNLYFNITVGDEESSEAKQPKIKLYVAFCIENAPFRNWMNIPTISLGGNKFMSSINVCQDSKPIYAFANIIGVNDIVISSPVLAVMPKSLGIKAKQGVNHRKIYDGSMGEDGWTSRDGGTITLVQGPFGIEGVTCNTNSIITFKPGDPLFQVSEDTLLQIMVCGKPQSLCVTVSDKTNSYSCHVDIKSEGDWHKFSLSHINFKGLNGPLADWSQILTLEFYSDEAFIIGSVLWV